MKAGKGGSDGAKEKLDCARSHSASQDRKPRLDKKEERRYVRMGKK